jgi:tRNA (cytidine/uridine-2'-O-)-methyltransferase
MRLVLFQPDIPQNAGTLMRLAACLGLGVDIIEPCGFILDDRRVRRAGMDYLDALDWTRHRSWDAYQAQAETGPGIAAGRLILLTTAAVQRYTALAFRPDDRLMVGRETAGVPAQVHAVVTETVRIPMLPGRRSLNVAVAAAMVVGEALRQTDGFSA